MTRNCTRQKGLLISMFLTMMNECPGGSDDLIVFICCRWRPHRTSVSTACDEFATIKPMPTSRPLILITSHSGHGIRLKMPPVHLHLFAPSFYPQLEHNRIILILASLPRMPFYHLYLLQWYYPSRTHSNVAYWRSQLRSHPDPHLLLCVSSLYLFLIKTETHTCHLKVQFFMYLIYLSKTKRFFKAGPKSESLLYSNRSQQSVCDW